MAFVKDKIEKKIEKKRQESPDFRDAWDNSREEYRLIGDMINIKQKSEANKNAPT